MARYIILPPRGLLADTPGSMDFLAGVVGSNVSTRPPERRGFAAVLSAAGPAPFDPFERRPATDTGPGPRGRAGDGGGEEGGVLHLIDALHETGAKLVELSPEDAERFDRGATLARIAPEVEYSYDPAPRLAPLAPPPGAAGGAIVLVVRCAGTGVPLAQVAVTLLVDVAKGLGAAGVTDGQGCVRLAVGTGPVAAQLLHVASPASAHWGLCLRGRPVSDQDVLTLAPIDAAADPIAALRAPVGDDTPGAGVRIAVVDSGIGPHAALIPAAMVNVVPGQPAGDAVDNGIGHGTHVGGIIAGRAAPFRGIAPGAQIYCYRVGAGPGEPPTSYSVMKAMDRAADAGCIIINLSLSTSTDDVAVREAVRDVNLRGCVVVAAAGNGWRDPIAEPARCDEAIAVSAYGDQAMVPAGTDSDYYIAAPSAAGRNSEYVASFSNVAAGGVGMGLIAPGVGVISLALGGGCRVMHGTSMATAVASAQIARLLAQRPDILAMPPDHARSVAIRQLVYSHAKRRGFGIPFEGYGAL